MMRRRVSVALLAGVLLAGLTAVPGAPAGAQDIADLPRLGYEINPTQGFVGDEVHSQVNVDDLREHCWPVGHANPETPVPDAVNSFQFDFMMSWSPGFTLEVLEMLLPVDPYFEELLPQIIAQYGWFAPEDNPGFAANDAVREGPVPEGIPDDQAGQNFMNFVGAAVSTATGFLAIGILTTALYPELHVTTFVDPVSQEMLGEMGNFDAETGEGTMLVPELDPGLYAVAAACAFLVPQDQFVEALTAGYVAAWEWSVENDFFPTGVAQAGWEEWAEAGGFGALFGELVEPRAIGIDFYCILQDDGFCATPPGPVGLIDDGVLDEFNGDGDDPLAPGPGAEDGDHPADTGDLVAVQATPAFTG